MSRLNGDQEEALEATRNPVAAQRAAHDPWVDDKGSPGPESILSVRRQVPNLKGSAVHAVAGEPQPASKRHAVVIVRGHAHNRTVLGGLHERGEGYQRHVVELVSIRRCDERLAGLP